MKLLERKRRDTDSGTATAKQRTSTTASPSERSTSLRTKLADKMKGVRQETGPWSGANRAATRVALAAIVATALTGPAALVIALTTGARPSSAPTAPAHPVAQESPDHDLAIATAQRFVQTWLSSTSKEADQVQDLLLTEASDLQLQKTATPPAAVAVTTATQTQPGLWRTTVVSTSGTGGEMAEQAFEVWIRVENNRSGVVSLPARVAVPEAGNGQLRARNEQVLSSEHPATATAVGFTTSLLTGADDLTRWLAPTAAIDPISPQACEAVKPNAATGPRGLSDTPQNGQATTVVITVTCQGASGPTETEGTTYQYSLDMTGRDGRWEVAKLATNPAITDPASDTPTDTPTATATPN